MHQEPGPGRDGARDFDFEIGEWTTELEVLDDPLRPYGGWRQLTGRTVVRPLAGGAANVAELLTDGEPPLRVLALRLYCPGEQMWSLHAANIADGVLTPPMVGAFHDGVGVFYGEDRFGDVPVLARFTVLRVDSSTCRFEQALSTDSGGRWWVSWRAVDRRDAG